MQKNTRERPKVLISVDPGSMTGWSRWIDGSYVDSGVMSKDDGDEAWLIQSINRLLTGVDGCFPLGRKTLVIENQFLGRNPNTHKKLIESRMKWQVCAHLLGWEVITLSPSTWQSKILGKVPKGKTKERSILYAETLTGKRVYFDHVADSICIGRFYLNQFDLPHQVSFGWETRKAKKLKKRRGK